MTTTAEERFAELYDIARMAARQIAPGHQGYTTEDDLTQDAILWLLEHEDRVRRAELPDGTLYVNRLVAEVSRHLVRIALKERERAGQVVPDRFTYSIQLVELVLPAVFDPTYRPPQMEGPVFLTGGRSENGPGFAQRQPSDPASLTNWATLVADVKRGVEAVCSDTDRRILFARSVGGWSWKRFGEEYGHSGEWHRQRYHEAIRRVSEYLSDGVVVDSDMESEAIAAALDDPAFAPYLAGDPLEDEWRVMGKDPYREPEYD